MSVIVMEIQTITALADIAVRAEIEMRVAKILFAGCTCLGRRYVAYWAERTCRQFGFRFGEMAEEVLFRVTDRENGEGDTIGVPVIASRFLGLK